jgi:hypothetical protein
MFKSFKNIKLDLVAIFALILLVLIFLNRAVRMEGVFFGADEIGSDLLHFAYPYREFWATDYLKKGQVPLWNPYLGSGLPILAEAQTGIFYLPAIILYYFLRPEVAFNYLIIFCFVFAALGTYWFGRRIGLRPAMAFFSASVFVLSGFMWGHLRHVPIITAVVFMPWMFWLTEKILEQPRLIFGGLLSILVALSFLAGHLTSTYLIILVLSVYFLLRLGQNFARWQKENMWPVVLFGTAVLLGMMVASVQLVPSLELISYSTRPLGGTERMVGPLFAWKYLVFFLSPYLLGDPSRGTWNMDKENYWENIGYLGILPLLLALLALVFGLKKQRQVGLPLKFCLTLTLVLTLGLLTPVYRWFLGWVPGFSFTRVPGRFLLFVDFFGAILAGFGLEMVVRKVVDKWRRVILAAIIFLSVADLFYFGYPFNAVIPTTYFLPPSSAKWLLTDNSLFRIRTFGKSVWRDIWQASHGWRGDLSGYMVQRETLPLDYNLLFRLPTPSLVYALVGHFSVKRAGELDHYIVQEADREPEGRLTKLLGMENIKYLVSPEKHDLPGLEQVAELATDHKDLTIYIYRNQDWLPRAYFVGKAENFINSQQLLGTMLVGEFEPTKEIFLEGAQDYPPTPGRGEVKIEEYRDRQIILDTHLEDDGFVVLSDTYYPGWQATVDGKPTEILLANYNYRAVRVGAGNHKIIFAYDPFSVKIGKIISIASFFLVLLLFFISVFIDRKRGMGIL